MTSASHLIGIDFNRRTDDKEYALGTPALDDQNRNWVYVRASEVVAIGTATVSGAFALTDAAGLYTADAAFALNEYGWVRKTASPL